MENHDLLSLYLLQYLKQMCRENILINNSQVYVARSDLARLKAAAKSGRGCESVRRRDVIGGIIKGITCSRTEQRYIDKWIACCGLG